MKVPPTLEARTADRAIRQLAQGDRGAGGGTTARGTRHGRQRGRRCRGAPRDDRGPDLTQADAGNGEVKDKTVRRTAAGTVYRRTSKRRV